MSAHSNAARQAADDAIDHLRLTTHRREARARANAWSARLSLLLLVGCAALAYFARWPRLSWLGIGLDVATTLALLSAATAWGRWVVGPLAIGHAMVALRFGPEPYALPPLLGQLHLCASIVAWLGPWAWYLGQPGIERYREWSAQRADRRRRELIRRLGPRCTFFDRHLTLGRDATVDAPDAKPTDGGGGDITLDEATGKGHVLATGVYDADGTDSILAVALAQAIRRYPAPPPVPRDMSGRLIVTPAWHSDEHLALAALTEGVRSPRSITSLRARSTLWLRGLLAEDVEALINPVLIAAYGGLDTEAQVRARAIELERLHRECRPAVFVINALPRGLNDDLAYVAEQQASADSRTRHDDVFRLSPDLQTSVPAVPLEGLPVQIAEDLLRAAERAEEYEPTPGHIVNRGRCANILTAVITATRRCSPARVTWAEIISVLRTFDHFRRWVAFLGLMDQKRPAAFPSAFSTHDLAPTLDLLHGFAGQSEKWFRDATSIIDTYTRHVTESMQHMLLAEVPSLQSYDEAVRSGTIVIVDLPMPKHGPVAIVHGQAQLAAYLDAVQRVAADRERGGLKRSVVIVIELADFYITEAIASKINQATRLGVTVVAAGRLFPAAYDRNATLLGSAKAVVAFREADGINARRVAAGFGSVERAVSTVTVTEWHDAAGVANGYGNPGYSRGTEARTEIVPFAEVETLLMLPQREAFVRLTDDRSPLARTRMAAHRIADIAWLQDARPIRPYATPRPFPQSDLGRKSGVTCSPDRLLYLLSSGKAELRGLVWVHLFTDGDGRPSGLLLFSQLVAVTVDLPLPRDAGVVEILKAAVGGRASVGTVARVAASRWDVIGRHVNVVVAGSRGELMTACAAVGTQPPAHAYYPPARELASPTGSGASAMLPQSIAAWRAWSPAERSRRLRHVISATKPGVLATYPAKRRHA